MNWRKLIPSDEQLAAIIGNLLRFAVTVAAIFVLFGGILYLIKYGGSLPDYRVFHGEPKDLRSIGGIIREVLDFRRRGLIQLGLLLLMLTPVVRVLFSLVAFALQRDRAYVIITLIVFGVLTFSLIWGGT
jgi:uncharacterized membrane protein